jgi:hypothetical protein
LPQLLSSSPFFIPFVATCQCFNNTIPITADDNQRFAEQMNKSKLKRKNHEKNDDCLHYRHFIEHV